MAYICAELDETSASGDGFSYGGANITQCKKWVELSPSATNATIQPEITQEQADDLALAVIYVMVLAWAWSLIRKFVEKQIR